MRATWVNTRRSNAPATLVNLTASITEFLSRRAEITPRTDTTNSVNVIAAMAIATYSW